VKSDNQLTNWTHSLLFRYWIGGLERYLTARFCFAVNISTMVLFTAVLLFTALIFSENPEVHAKICTASVCTFHLYAKLAKTMHYRAADYNLYPVTFINGTPTVNLTSGLLRLSQDDVIVADGLARDVIVFNGTIPGPTLEVMEGAQVGEDNFVEPIQSK
jgi:hypothetical protein